MILDTSFLLDLKDGDSDAFEKATDLYESAAVQRVSTVTAAELQYGATYAASEDERRRVRNLLSMYPLVPVAEDIALEAGELLAEADRRADGTSGVDTEDSYIAATAAQHAEAVLTRNVTDFERLGVDVETY